MTDEKDYVNCLNDVETLLRRDFIKKLLEYGIPYYVKFSGGKFDELNKERNLIGEYRLFIEGFYKSDVISVGFSQGQFYVYDRYDDTLGCSYVNLSFSDLARINFDWWQSSKDRFDGWKSFDYRWKQALLDEGYSEKE